MQSSLIRIMSGVVCLFTMPWNNLRWDAALSPVSHLSILPCCPSPRPAPALHLWHSSPCSSKGGYFSNHSFTGREEKDRSENTDLYMRHSPQFNYSPALFTPTLPRHHISSLAITYNLKGMALERMECMCLGVWRWGRWIGTIMNWMAALTENYTQNEEVPRTRVNIVINK